MNTEDKVNEPWMNPKEPVNSSMSEKEGSTPDKSAMTKQEIDNMCARYNSLTEEEKAILSKAIMANQETADIAIAGAVKSNNYPLAMYIIGQKSEPVVSQDQEEQRELWGDVLDCCETNYSDKVHFRLIEELSKKFTITRNP